MSAKSFPEIPVYEFTPHSAPHVMTDLPPGTDLTHLPAWDCANCGQNNSGWATECGRCETRRDAITPKPITAAAFAAQIRANDELREAIESSINWLDLRFPCRAKKTLLKAVKPTTKTQEPI